ncbi:MAG: hypothetical protein QW343_04075, partial [Candidatus Norongarragalinales archaeon]
HESDYAPFVKKKGGALYFLKNGKIKINPRYAKEKPKSREWKARRIWVDGLYASFTKAPNAFDFLTKPERVLYS